MEAKLRLEEGFVLINWSLGNKCIFVLNMKKKKLKRWKHMLRRSSLHQVANHFFKKSSK